MDATKMLSRRINNQQFGTIGENLDQRTKDAQLAINVSIVDNLANLILLARLLVWTTFIEVYHEKRSQWQAEYNAAPLSILSPELRAKRAWVIFQAFPRLNDNGEISNSYDIFETLADAMSDLTPEACKIQLKATIDVLRAQDYSPTLLVFDEVQKMASELTKAFPDTLRNAKRPLLKPVVFGLSAPFNAARIFVAGTRLYKADIDDALLSAVFKAHGNRMFSDLGGYFHDHEVETALHHFFTKKFVDSWPKDITQDVLFWFRGRFVIRFSSTYLVC